MGTPASIDAGAPRESGRDAGPPTRPAAPPPHPGPHPGPRRGARLAQQVSTDGLVLTVLRASFVLLLAAVGWFFVGADPDALGPLSGLSWLALTIAIVVGVLVVCADILSSRRKLAILSGAFLGLVVGLAVAYAFSFVIGLLVDQFLPSPNAPGRDSLVQFLNLTVGIVCCYLAISFVLQTKDDFRFIIPYVEFRKQARGNRPILLDSSALIDGRVADVAATGVFDVPLIVPRFVLLELQRVADSADRLKRNRGRRGLDVADRLKQTPGCEAIIYDSAGREGETDAAGDGPVDDRLMRLAQELDGRVLTTDFNLNKVAQLAGVEVLNLNDLANALKPEVLPGEGMAVRLVKAGEGSGQGVGYLDDGTMVVVEGGGRHVGREVEFTITNTRQTSAGKMIFGRLEGDGDSRRGSPREAQRHREER